MQGDATQAMRRLASAPAALGTRPIVLLPRAAKPRFRSWPEKIVQHPIRVAGRIAAGMNLAEPFKARTDLCNDNPSHQRWLESGVLNAGLNDGRRGKIDLDSMPGENVSTPGSAYTPAAPAENVPPCANTPIPK
jgi:hypothetical protein